MKKRIAAILALLVAFSQTSVFADGDFKYINENDDEIYIYGGLPDNTYGNFKYETEGNTITIVKYNGSDADVTIPSEIGDKMVT